MECSICLETYVHPVRLPCKHIFCFLCVKGISQLYKRCAICRQSIPDNYFENPVLIETIEKSEDGLPENCTEWFYEGKNGWWLYDKRAIEEIEEAFKSGSSKCQLLIAGFLYIIDFVKMIQYRKDEPHRQRKIKRDELKATVSKGVAGLKIDQSKSILQSGQLLRNEPDKQIKNECKDDDEDDDDDNDEDHDEDDDEDNDEDNDDRNRSNQPNGNNEVNQIDEEEKERLTNQRLDALAYNFMQSLNLREPDLHETYL